MQAGEILLDRFQLIRHIGQGGIGQVWLSHDLKLEGEPIAIKVLKEELDGDRRAVADLKREVLLTRKLRHPHILGVYTFWESAACRFITMEYIDGLNLAQCLAARQRAYPLHEILPWLENLSSALDYAHSKGVLHRDVKPGNLLLNRENQIFLADFGIARTAREVQSRLSGELTAGTLMYISPEQLTGERLDSRSDLYSLGATVYELLTGHAPFHTGSIVTQIQFKPVPAGRHLAQGVNDVLLKALAKKPEQRFGSCAEFAAALRGAHSALCIGTETLPAQELPECLPPSEDSTRDIQAQHPREARLRLGYILVDANAITEAQLDTALASQDVRDRPLGQVLAGLGYVTDEQIARAVAQQLKVPFLALETEPIQPEASALLTRAQALARHCVPIRLDPEGITVAMTDPLDFSTINELEATFGRRVNLVITTPGAIAVTLERIYPLTV
ncbi:MAG: protein kinase [Candidatus Hydrogenedentes bacterium]|nr:protein kinase [Candidatus Hydrogenedentota bacterium]